MICALLRSILMSLGLVQWVGSDGSVEQISVTLSIISEDPSGFQNEMQTSCMQYPGACHFVVVVNLGVGGGGRDDGLVGDLRSRPAYLRKYG